MSEFKIKKNVPIPERGGGRNQRYPFPDMKKGDSFSCPISLRHTVQSAAASYKMRHPWFDYCTKTVGDEVRVWCISQEGEG